MKASANSTESPSPTELSILTLCDQAEDVLRYAHADIELDDVTIAAGDLVLLALHEANTDPWTVATTP